MQGLSVKMPGLSVKMPGLSVVVQKVHCPNVDHQANQYQCQMVVPFWQRAVVGCPMYDNLQLTDLI
jgi:hypothetical protein